MANFREAVRRAAATPFLCGAGPAGWRANFDCIIANDTNHLKVLEGRYDAGDASTIFSGAESVSVDPPTRKSQFGNGDWSARTSMRDEAARRMIRAGAGPEAHPSVRVRTDVLHRAPHRA